MKEMGVNYFGKFWLIAFVILLLTSNACAQNLNEIESNSYYVFKLKSDTSKTVLVKESNFSISGTLKSGKRFYFSEIISTDSLGINLIYGRKLVFNEVEKFKFRPYRFSKHQIIGGYYLTMLTIGTSILWNVSFADGYDAKLPIYVFMATSVLWATIPPIVLSAILSLPFVTQDDVILSSIQPVSKP